jgi:pimeloyl-ACP methyl ester carboxylesterase
MWRLEYRTHALVLVALASILAGCRSLRTACDCKFTEQPGSADWSPAGWSPAETSSDAAKLEFLEAYQPGKAPVVLIHGLYSEPRSWNKTVRCLRSNAAFVERYQIWTFGYPTGQGFLQSAAALRRELRAAVDRLDPGRQDAALRRMVLVGHSMGGLIAKLQVTHSEELVWTRLANRPLEEIVTTPATQAFLAQTCYFDPSPDVDRVIFIASPHAGALHSSSCVGSGLALLIKPTPEQAAMHAQLMRDNPHTFNPQIEARFPTSLDMLRQDSPLLSAMQEMCLRRGVKLHNIIGASHPISLDGPSDGVVSVHSASHPGCQSVYSVGVFHTRVHQAPETSAELLRILGCFDLR